jgi:hypothetical protein
MRLDVGGDDMLEDTPLSQSRCDDSLIVRVHFIGIFILKESK